MGEDPWTFRLVGLKGDGDDTVDSCSTGFVSRTSNPYSVVLGETG